MKVVFSTFAQREYQEAVLSYDDQSGDLGDQFIEEIEEGIRLILTFPNAWAKAGDKHRKYVLKRFPYVILFKVYPDQVVVFAIAHQHRNPSHYLRRGQP